MAASPLAKFNSTSSYILGVYPRWQDMDFSKDCEIYGEWLAAYTTMNRANKTLVLGAPLYYTPTFVNMALPDDFKFPNGYVFGGDQRIYTTVEAELNSWFYENLREYQPDGTARSNEDFLRHVIYDPFKKCDIQYCKAIGFIGNADMTGMGVMITYYIGAGFATAYLIAFTIERYKQARRQSNSRQGMPMRAATFGHTASKRLLEAFHGSFFGYITAAMMLCVSMLIAGIYIAIDRLLKNKEPEGKREVVFGNASIYDMSLAMASCVFSIFPILVGYCFMRSPGQGQQARHKKSLRRAVLGFIWVLIILELFLSPRAEYDYVDRKADIDRMNKLQRQEYEAQYECDQRGGHIYWNIVKATQFMIIGLPLLWFVATVFVFKGFAIPRFRNSPTLQRLRKIWHLIPAYISLLFMWGSLGFLQWYRQKIRNNSGKIGGESEMGFGQILALFVWVPTIVEFFYILIWGLQDSLQSHMPPNFQLTVQRKSQGFQSGNIHYGDADEARPNDEQPDCEKGGYKRVPVISSRATTMYDPQVYSAPAVPPQAAPVPQVAIADGFYAQDMSGNWQMVSREQAAMIPGCLQIVDGRVVPSGSNPRQM